MARLQGHRLTLATSGAAIALLAAGLAGRPAYAIDFDIDGWTGSADTTLLSSGTVRTEAPDLKAQGSPYFANGQFNAHPTSTRGFGTNTPTDGDLNFKQGDLVSQPNRITEELSLKRDETSIFIRGTAFYDTVLSTGSNADFRQFDHGSIDASGHAAHLLDAFIDQKFDLAGNASSIRIGNQVINWGESTFIQGGINSAAPVDATAAHTPGTELKDIILPVTAFDFRTSFGANYSFETYYQLLNVHDRLDGEGSFFAGNVAAPGGLYVVEGSSHRDPFQDSLNAIGLGPGQAALGYITERDPDKSAHNLSKEFGAAFRTTVPEMSDAEFGLYFENYASRTPFPQFRTGTKEAGVANELGLIGLGPATSYTATSGISLTYPENIHLLGGSFNFNGPYGLAFQGEISNRFNQPLLLNGGDSALANALPILCDTTAPLYALATAADCTAALMDPVIQLEGGNPGYNTLFQTYKRYSVSQLQFGITKLWSDVPDTPIQTVTFVAEAGLDYVHGFPSMASIFSAVNSTDSQTGFNNKVVDSLAGTSVNGFQSTQLATQTSYGYVMYASFDMPHTMPASIDMTPHISFTHDVQGTSPVGAGFFVAHNASIGIGVDFSYLQNLNWGLTYATNFMIGGSPEQNVNIDKDFVSAYISYSF
jgi:Protein of unknown function (DUF1302)